MIKSPILLAAFVCAAAAAAAQPEPIDSEARALELTREAFRAYVAHDHDDDWFATFAGHWAFPDDHQLAYAASKQHFADNYGKIRRYYGSATGYELLGTKALSDRLLKLQGLIHCDYAPMPLDVQFYRTGEVWKVVSVRFGNEVDVGAWSVVATLDDDDAGAPSPGAEAGAPADPDPPADPAGLP